MKRYYVNWAPDTAEALVEDGQGDWIEYRDHVTAIDKLTAERDKFAAQLLDKYSTESKEYHKVLMENMRLKDKCDTIAQQTWERMANDCCEYWEYDRETNLCIHKLNNRNPCTFNQCPAMGEQQPTLDE